MGLFGISEVLLNVEQGVKRDIFQSKIRGLLPNLQDWKDSALPITRGSILGFFLGILPGGGALISSFVSYAMEKKISRHPEKFGTGVIEGVAGPETANNAATGGAFIPLLTLGIPANVVMAMLLGALLIHGMQPGPMLLQSHPDLFWGVVTSMYVGNGMLLLLNLPLIGLWVQVLKVPYRILFPLILLFCLIGAYSINYAVDGRSHHDRLRGRGVPDEKIRVRGRPPGARVCPRPDAGDGPASIADDVQRAAFPYSLSRPISAIGILAALLLVVSPLLPWVGKRRTKMTKEI